MKVILYTTHCPKCNVLEKKLKEAAIEFETEDDINKLIEKGFMSAPILEVDGNNMDFGAAIKWVNEVPQDNNDCDSCKIN